MYSRCLTHSHNADADKRSHTHKQGGGGTRPHNGIVGRSVCEVHVACRRAVCVLGSVCSSQVHRWCHAGVFHSALGMMVKGRMGLLASSSRAVMKHSVAAAVFP